MNCQRVVIYKRLKTKNKPLGYLTDDIESNRKLNRRGDFQSLCNGEIVPRVFLDFSPGIFEGQIGVEFFCTDCGIRYYDEGFPTDEDSLNEFLSRQSYVR